MATEGYEGQSKSRGPSTLTIVLSIVGALLVLGCLVCAGSAYLFFRAAGPALKQGMEALQGMAKGMETARNFLQHLHANRIDQAYALTTKAYRNAHPQNDLEELLKRYPDFQKSGAINQQHFGFAPPTDPSAPHEVTYEYTTPAGHEEQVRLRLVKEGDSVLVDEVEFEGTNASGRDTAQSTRKATTRTEKSLPTDKRPTTPARP